MIVIVKKDSKKKIIIKAISLVVLLGMFSVYYFHMGDLFLEMENKHIVKKQKPKLSPKEILARKLEKVIYKEAEDVVDLIGQKKIKKITIGKNALILLCDTNTDVEPVLIKYGIMALVKMRSNHLKISISLRYIIEQNYKEDFNPKSKVAI